MGKLASFANGAECGITEDVLRNQMESINMLQHIVDLVNDVYSDVIYNVTLSSDDDITKKDISNARRVRISVTCLSDDIDRYNEVCDTFAEFIEDEIPWSDNVEFTTCRIGKNVDWIPFPYEEYQIPIYSSKNCLLEYNEEIHNNQRLEFEHILEDGIELYLASGFMHRGRNIVLIDGSDIESVDKLISANVSNQYIVIRLFNIEEYAKKLGCIKLTQDSLVYG